MERSTHPLAVKSQRWFVEALLRLMKQKPFEEITITELCKEADLDRRTFYRNFKDKNDVLTVYFSALEQEYLNTLRFTGEHSFYSLAKVQFSFWRGHLQFLQTAHMDQTLCGMLIQVTNRLVPAIYSKMSGSLSDKSLYHLAFVIGGFHNVLTHWISTGLRETPEEIAAILSEMFNEQLDYWPKL